MPKVCIQAGHKNIYSGATGATGERDWNTAVVTKIATLLKNNGFEVYEADAKADTNADVVGKDWDLFLAIHYDADIYNDRGGFVDFPDPSVDQVTQESQRIAGVLSKFYAKMGIPTRPNRSNANTKFYYMWRALTAKTPCVIMECGVGWRKPEDYNTLWGRMDEVAQTIAELIAESLGAPINQKPFNFDHTKKMPDEAWKLLGYGNRKGIKREWALDTLGEEFAKLYASNEDLNTKLSKYQGIETTVESQKQVILDMTQAKEIQDGKISQINSDLQIEKEKAKGVLKAFTPRELVMALLEKFGL